MTFSITNSRMKTDEFTWENQIKRKMKPPKERISKIKCTVSDLTSEIVKVLNLQEPMDVDFSDIMVVEATEIGR